MATALLPLLEVPLDAEPLDEVESLDESATAEATDEMFTIVVMLFIIVGFALFMIVIDVFDDVPAPDITVTVDVVAANGLRMQLRVKKHKIFI